MGRTKTRSHVHYHLITDARPKKELPPLMKLFIEEQKQIKLERDKPDVTLTNSNLSFFSPLFNPYTPVKKYPYPPGFESDPQFVALKKAFSSSSRSWNSARDIETDLKDMKGSELYQGPPTDPWKTAVTNTQGRKSSKRVHTRFSLPSTPRGSRASLGMGASMVSSRDVYLYPTVEECIQSVWYGEEGPKRAGDQPQVRSRKSFTRIFKKEYFSPSGDVGDLIEMHKSGSPIQYFKENDIRSHSRGTRHAEDEIKCTETDASREKYPSVHFLADTKEKVVEGYWGRNPPTGLPKPMIIRKVYDQNLISQLLNRIREDTKSGPISTHRPSPRPAKGRPRLKLKDVIQVTLETGGKMHPRARRQFHNKTAKLHDVCVCT